MRMPVAWLETIEDFLAEKQITMIGASRDRKDFSGALLRRCGNAVTSHSR